MIAGIGIDIAETSRFLAMHEKYGERFARRILTDFEHQQLQRKVHPELYLATRFAAKEAAAKALGTGFDQGVGYKSIEVKNNVNGKPELSFYGAATKIIEQKKINNILLTLSDEKHYVVAMVVAESN
jgi:holo-[acyl-carrier protein] synthase